MRKRKALLIRHGAFGDNIQASAVIPYLQADGYLVDVMTGERGRPIFEHNPRVNKVIHFTDNCVPISELDAFYESQSKFYDNTITLTGCVESKYLFSYPYDEYYWCLGKRRKKASHENYVESQIRHAGYEPNGIRTGELYFSQEDLIFSRNFREKFKDRFILLWALTGSALHKKYFYFAPVVKRLIREIPEILVVTTGDIQATSMLTFEDKRRIVNFGYYQKPIMTSMALASIADLVIGPETAMLNAAGCFDTPKICMLTHSSKQNLTSTWKNDFSLQSATYCSPCHILSRFSYLWKTKCPLSLDILANYGAEIPACVAEGFPIETMVEQVMKVYELTKKRQLPDGRKKV